MSRNYSRVSMEPKEPLSDLVSFSGLPSTGKGLLMRTLRSRYAMARPLVRYFGASDLVSHYVRTQSHNGGNTPQGFERDVWHKVNFDLQTMGQFNCNWLAGQMAHIFTPKGFHVKLNRSMTLRLQEMGLQGKSVSAAELEREDEALIATFEERYPGCSWSDGDFDLVVCMDQCSGPAIDNIVETVVSNYLEWQRHHSWRMSFGAT